MNYVIVSLEADGIEFFRSIEGEQSYPVFRSEEYVRSNSFIFTHGGILEYFLSESALKSKRNKPVSAKHRQACYYSRRSRRLPAKRQVVMD